MVTAHLHKAISDPVLPIFLVLLVLTITLASNVLRKAILVLNHFNVLLNMPDHNGEPHPPQQGSPQVTHGIPSDAQPQTTPSQSQRRPSQLQQDLSQPADENTVSQAGPVPKEDDQPSTQPKQVDGSDQPSSNESIQPPSSDSQTRRLSNLSTPEVFSDSDSKHESGPPQPEIPPSTHPPQQSGFQIVRDSTQFIAPSQEESESRSEPDPLPTKPPSQSNSRPQPGPLQPEPRPPEGRRRSSDTGGSDSDIRPSLDPPAPPPPGPLQPRFPHLGQPSYRPPAPQSRPLAPRPESQPIDTQPHFPRPMDPQARFPPPNSQVRYPPPPAQHLQPGFYRPETRLSQLQPESRPRFPQVDTQARPLYRPPAPEIQHRVSQPGPFQPEFRPRPPQQEFQTRPVYRPPAPESQPRLSQAAPLQPEHQPRFPHRPPAPESQPRLSQPVPLRPEHQPRFPHRPPAPDSQPRLSQPGPLQPEPRPRLPPQTRPPAPESQPRFQQPGPLQPEPRPGFPHEPVRPPQLYSPTHQPPPAAQPHFTQPESRPPVSQPHLPNSQGGHSFHSQQVYVSQSHSTSQPRPSPSPLEFQPRIFHPQQPSRKESQPRIFHPQLDSQPPSSSRKESQPRIFHPQLDTQPPPPPRKEFQPRIFHPQLDAQPPPKDQPPPAQPQRRFSHHSEPAPSRDEQQRRVSATQTDFPPERPFYIQPQLPRFSTQQPPQLDPNPEFSRQSNRSSTLDRPPNPSKRDFQQHPQAVLQQPQPQFSYIQPARVPQPDSRPANPASDHRPEPTAPPLLQLERSAQPLHGPSQESAYERRPPGTLSPQLSDKQTRPVQDRRSVTELIDKSQVVGRERGERDGKTRLDSQLTEGNGKERSQLNGGSRSITTSEQGQTPDGNGSVTDLGQVASQLARLSVQLSRIGSASGLPQSGGHQQGQRGLGGSLSAQVSYRIQAQRIRGNSVMTDRQPRPEQPADDYNQQRPPPNQPSNPQSQPAPNTGY